MQDRIFYAVCLGFAVGVLLRSFIFVNFFTVVFLGGLAAGIIFLFLIFKNKWGIIAGVFIIFISLGILRFHIADKVPAIFPEGEQTFFGIIVDEPDIRENNQKLTVKIDPTSLKLRGASTKVLVTTNFSTEYKYGDAINFEGQLQKPKNFITDQGKDFDYLSYLRKDGIFYLVSYPEVEIISRGNGSKIRSSLFAVKEKLLEKMNWVIAPPDSLLMGGLILGERSAFNENLRKNLITTGTIHIVALSGYNVTIVAEWVMKLFYFLPRNLGIGVGALMILLFVLMTGASSTALRAGIMAVLALIARATGRNYDIARALVLAGVFMILLNPFVLVYDVSFQLSFIATVAVIFFAPKIEKYFLWLTDKFKLRDIVSVTVAVYLFVLPFILYKMGNLSVVALPANILILPLIPFTMGLGFLTSFLGLLWYPLSVPLGFISSLFLSWELGVIDFFARLPLASFSVPNFPLILTLLIYAWFVYKLFGRDIKMFFSTSVATPENFSQSLPN